MLFRKRFECGAGQRWRTFVNVQAGIFQRGGEQVAVQLGIVLDVNLLLAALDFVERRLRYVDMPALDQLRHLPVEKGQQQGSNVRAVDVGVSHDDDAMITQLVGIEVVPADATAKRGDQRANLGGRQHFIEARFFNIKDLALERQYRLRAAIAALLRRATSRVALDQEELGKRRVFLLAVRQLARQAGDVQRALAPGHLSRLARRFARPGGIDNLRHDRLGVGRVFQQELLEPLGHGRLDHALDLGRHELVLGLRREFRIRHLDGQHRGQSFARIVACRAAFILACRYLFFDIGIQCSRERRAKAR